jgi:hypothetical protein
LLEALHHQRKFGRLQVVDEEQQRAVTIDRIGRDKRTRQPLDERFFPRKRPWLRARSESRRAAFHRDNGVPFSACQTVHGGGFPTGVQSSANAERQQRATDQRGEDQGRRDG